MAKRVEIKLDNVGKVFKDIEKLVGQRVLIGIPEAKAPRGDEEINNATIGYIQEFGSPKANIPARPFLIPGVRKAEKSALAQLRKAADATLAGDPQKADQYLNGAGIIAANEVRAMINSNIPPPLSPSTIAGRAAQRKTKSMRKSEKEYFRLLDTGMSPGAAQNTAGIVSLVNTGALRSSVTYVLKKK
jgi:hypothetical protein